MKPDSHLSRQLMVEEQLRSRGITDSLTLTALSRVPRERFVPPELEPYAYDDGPLPIGRGQTISQPYIVAVMTQSAKLSPQDSVLEVGTGSGYQAAILAEICRTVHTIERIPSLAAQAEKTLVDLRYTNVICHTADGTLGLPEHSPYDVILVTAGSPTAPQALCDQLASGGRLIIPVGSEVLQNLIRITKQPDNSLRQETLETVRFVPLIGQQGWPTS